MKSKILYIGSLCVLICATCGIKKQVSTRPPEKITVKDIDGNIYKTVKIGTQVWMEENLKTTRYDDSTPIPLIQDSTVWGDYQTGAYCYYRNSLDNQYNFGNLYNWYAVNDARKLAPKGWHIPSSEEWDILINFIGGDSATSPKLRQTGSIFWEAPNNGATNESGFSALPAGFRFCKGNFFDWEYTNIGWVASFWTSTNFERRKYYANFIRIYSGNGNIGKLEADKNFGMSVRCIKD